jgi:hypothetical protein
LSQRAIIGQMAAHMAAETACGQVLSAGAPLGHPIHSGYSAMSMAPFSTSKGNIRARSIHYPLSSMGYFRGNP